MDKSLLMRRIIEMYPQLKSKDAEQVVRVILDALCCTLVKGGRIEIRGFGSFSLLRLPPKQKRSTKTGFKLKDPAKYTPQFKPAKELRSRADKCNGAVIAERCRPPSASPNLCNRDLADDMEETAIYA